MVSRRRFRIASALIVPWALVVGWHYFRANIPQLEIDRLLPSLPTLGAVVQNARLLLLWAWMTLVFVLSGRFVLERLGATGRSVALCFGAGTGAWTALLGALLAARLWYAPLILCTFLAVSVLLVLIYFPHFPPLRRWRIRREVVAEKKGDEGGF